MSKVRIASWVKSKKLTKANSAMFNETIFYIAKKNYEEKAFSLYVAYIFPEGISVMWHSNKDTLLEWLSSNIDRIEHRFKSLQDKGSI